MTSPAAPSTVAAARPGDLRLTGSTLLFPVIGHPVRQVRAPAVFNALFVDGGVDAVCFGLDLPPQSVLETCRALLESPSVGGMLVTVPYKKVLVSLADRLGAAARQVGAVNALRRASDGCIEGDLLDGVGFVRGLEAAGHAVKGRRVLLLGAGGAGSAIAAALAEAQAAEIGIYDPHGELGAALQARLQPLFPGTVLRAAGQAAHVDYDIVINASPVGLAADDPLPLDPARLAPGTLVCDVIMEPPTTAFLHAAASRGLNIHRGQHMLDHQVPAYLSFFGFASLAQRVRVGADSITLG